MKCFLAIPTILVLLALAHHSECSGLSWIDNLHDAVVGKGQELHDPVIEETDKMKDGWTPDSDQKHDQLMKDTGKLYDDNIATFQDTTNKLFDKFGKKLGFSQ